MAAADGRATLDVRPGNDQSSIDGWMENLGGVLWVFLACLPLVAVSTCLTLWRAQCADHIIKLATYVLAQLLLLLLEVEVLVLRTVLFDCATLAAVHH